MSKRGKSFFSSREARVEEVARRAHTKYQKSILLKFNNEKSGVRRALIGIGNACRPSFFTQLSCMILICTEKRTRYVCAAEKRKQAPSSNYPHFTVFRRNQNNFIPALIATIIPLSESENKGKKCILQSKRKRNGEVFACECIVRRVCA